MNKVFPSKVSVIVTTYNWPHALQSVLLALSEQKTAHSFEVIIADDGSNEETAKLIRGFKKRTHIPILHIWQPDDGFRVAAIRNKAILAAEGDYILFLDGDCVPRENFIERHLELSEAQTFVVGNRVLLNREFTLAVLSEALPLHRWPLWRWFKARLYGHCNRLFPLFSLPAGWPRLKSATRWQGAKGCNLGVWKSDLLQVNGWEEKFTGWGYEDSDLIIRLLRSHVQRKNARFYIPVFHLWHPENDRTQERQNWSLLKDRQNGMQLCAEKGLNQYES